MKRTRGVVAVLLLALGAFGVAHSSDLDVFRDDFNGSLNGKWAILRKDTGYYSFTSDYLDLRANRGDLWEWRTDARQRFYRVMVELF